MKYLVRTSVDAASPRVVLQVKLTFILRVAIAHRRRHSGELVASRRVQKVSFESVASLLMRKVELLCFNRSRPSEFSPCLVSF